MIEQFALSQPSINLRNNSLEQYSFNFGNIVTHTLNLACYTFKVLIFCLLIKCIAERMWKLWVNTMTE